MRALMLSAVLLSSCREEVVVVGQDIEIAPVVLCDIGPSAGIRILTDCGGFKYARSTGSALGVAAADVIARFPNARAAASSNGPRFMGAHQTNGFGGQAELEGFGVTYVQFTGIASPVESASGELNDPNLLFFEKVGNNKADWPIIGMGYSFEFDPCERPTLESIPSCKFWVHEAAYHHSPGSGNFTCAETDDLKNSARNDGKFIDEEMCIAIEDGDLREDLDDAEHGRLWDLHVWFEPDTNRPIIAKTDPYCRQSTAALAPINCGDHGGFPSQGDCSEICGE